MVCFTTIIPHSALAKNYNGNNNNDSYTNNQYSSYSNDYSGNSHCHSSSSVCYNNGYNPAWYQAQMDWNSGQYSISSGGNNSCPTGHSTYYCNGWNQGYQDLWAQWTYNQAQRLNLVNSPQQTQCSDVNTNIKGNGNTVNNIITQGQAANYGNGDPNDGRGSNGGELPTCRILCSVIK
jgi:hypothetical protein